MVVSCGSMILLMASLLNPNFFAALLDQVLGSLVAAFIIINHHLGALRILFHPVKEDHGNSFFFKGFIMGEVLGIECQGGN